MRNRELSLSSSFTIGTQSGPSPPPGVRPALRKARTACPSRPPAVVSSAPNRHQRSTTTRAIRLSDIPAIIGVIYVVAIVSGCGTTHLARGRLVAVGSSHACSGWFGESEIWCWGQQLGGTGSIGLPTARPVRVALSAPLEGLTAGLMNTCTRGAGAITCRTTPSFVRAEEDEIVTLPLIEPRYTVTTHNDVCGEDGAGWYCAGLPMVIDHDRTVELSRLMVPPGRRIIDIRWQRAVLTDAGVLTSWNAPLASVIPTPPATAFCNDEGTCVLTSEGRVVFVGDDVRPFVSAVAEIEDVIQATDGCLLRRDGQVLCWWVCAGPSCTGLPTPVPLPAPAVSIDSNGITACAVLTDQSVWCWGNNTRGELGNGTFDESPSPTRVIGLPERAPRP